jgi:hypothetical protein
VKVLYERIKCQEAAETLTFVSVLD